MAKLRIRADTRKAVVGALREIAAMWSRETGGPKSFFLPNTKNDALKAGERAFLFRACADWLERNGDQEPR